MKTVLETPTVYLGELQNIIQDATGNLVSLSTICRTLQQWFHFSRKIRAIALQRSDDERACYMAKICVYDPSLFDESGSDRRNATNTMYGNSLRGETPCTFQFLSRGKRISAITALSNDGLLACTLHEGSINGAIFVNFLRTYLLPHLLPFNGTNPNSVIILDNCATHHR